MGLGKWLLSLMEPTPRNRDKSHQKAYAKKEKNRDPIKLSRLEPSTRVSFSEPPSAPATTETNFTLLTAQQQSALDAFRGAAMNAALGLAMQQEAAMSTGLSSLLQESVTMPYWKQMFGETGKRLGPFYPDGGPAAPRPGK